MAGCWGSLGNFQQLPSCFQNQPFSLGVRRYEKNGKGTPRIFTDIVVFQQRTRPMSGKGFGLAS